MSGNAVLVNAFIENEKPNSNHWFWGSWVILSILAASCLAICNIFIGELASLGIAGNYYYCTGSLLYSAGYFLRRNCCLKKEVRKDFIMKNDKF